MGSKAKAKVTKSSQPPVQTLGKRKRKPSEKAKKGGKKGGSDSSEEEVEVTEVMEVSESVNVKWDENNAALDWALIGEIGNEVDIKKGLFPPPGAIARQGGKKKSEHHWKLCIALFGDHDDYKMAFNRAAKGTAKEKQVWSNKIKNRLRKMTELTRKGIDILGATGAGIKTASDINMGDENEFTNKWMEVRDELGAPWFFEMRELIAQCPNLVPTGLGNSQSELDLGVVLPGVGDDNVSSDGISFGEEIDVDGESGQAIDEEFDEGDTGEPGGVAARGDVDDSSGDESVVAPKSKKGRLTAATPVQISGSNLKKTAPRASISSTTQPAKPPAAPPKKPKAIADFQDIALSEEKTRQMEIDLQKAKVMGKTQYDIEKIRTKGSIRKEQHRAALELEKIKLQNAYALELAKLRASTGQPASTVAGPSHFGTPPTYSQGDWSLFSQSRTSMGSPFPSHPNTPFSGDDDVRSEASAFSHGHGATSFANSFGFNVAGGMGGDATGQ